MARACYIGRVPSTDAEALTGALKSFVEASDAPFEFGVYAELQMTQKADIGALIALSPLLERLLAVQPAMRFLPSVLGEVLTKLLVDNPALNSSRRGNVAGVPHKQFAAAMSRRLITICYHFRRISRSPDEWSHLPEGDKDSFAALVGKFEAEVAPPAAARALKVQVSLESAISSDGDGISFAAAMGLGAKVENDSFRSAMGLADGGSARPSGQSAGSADSGPTVKMARTTVTDPISQAAVASTVKVLPCGKNALKKLVMKRPAGATSQKATCETAKTKALGDLKKHVCSSKSYITQHSKATNKYHLPVETTHEQHVEVIAQLWRKCVDSKKATKPDVMAWRKAIHDEFGKAKRGHDDDKDDDDDDEDGDSEDVVDSLTEED